MRSTIRQLIIGMALAIGLSAVGVSAIGGAVAHSAMERVPAMANDGVISGYASAPLDGGGRLGDRQQLRSYFLDGARDRTR